MTGSQGVSIPKRATHIAGLDQILEGGLPAGRTTLVIGGPGAGKTLFGLEYLYRQALAGEPGIFISFEETVEALRSNLQTLGWDLAALEKSGKLFLLDAQLDPKAVVAGEFGFEPFLAILDNRLRTMGAQNLVIDAIDVLMRLISDDSRARNELLALHNWLRTNAVTALLTVKAERDSSQGHRYDFMDYAADCVIHIDNRMLGQLSTRRLRVIKYRGSGFGSNEYPMVIDSSGITLLPISSIGLAHKALGDRVSTGAAGLDALIGGGFRSASSVLISGGSGSGKTLLCSAFTQAACARGEKVLYISLEESEAALVSAVRSAGIDLGPAIGTGSLRMITAMPEAMGAEQHLMLAMRAIEQLRPSCVIIESASACKRMGTEQAAYEYLMRLINICKEKGIIVLATNQTDGFLNQDEISGIGISSIADTIVLLRLVSENGQLQRRLLVMKSRGSDHSHAFHNFCISDSGIKILESRS